MVANIRGDGKLCGQRQLRKEGALGRCKEGSWCSPDGGHAESGSSEQHDGHAEAGSSEQQRQPSADIFGMVRCDRFGQKIELS